MKIKNKNKSFKLILALLAIILIIGFGFAARYITAASKDDEVKRDSSGISLERSKQEENESESLEENIEEKERGGSDTPSAPKTDTSTGLQKVNVILTNSGVNSDTIDASGFVSDATEEDGVCTFVFTQGGKSIQKKSSTLSNPTSTTCKTVRFNKSELSQGEWIVSLEYLSPRSAGKSNTSRIVVQ